MSIGARVFNFMVFIWLAGGFCGTYPEVAKHLAVLSVVAVVYTIPFLRSLFCWTLLISTVSLIIWEVYRIVSIGVGV